MGCGSSKKGPSYDEALPAHLARVLEMPTDQLVLKQYVASLRAEGWDSPNAFDDLTMDELKNKPFCFKAGHLRMVARSRKKSVGTGNAANDVDQPSLNRGRSSQQSQNGAEQIAAEAAPAADRGTHRQYRWCLDQQKLGQPQRTNLKCFLLEQRPSRCSPTGNTRF